MAESLDMVYRFAALDAGAVAGFQKLGEASRGAAISTKDLTAATLQATEAERLAAEASARAAQVRLQASVAMAHAKDLEIRGDAEQAAAAREAADALALQARAAQATARELTANSAAAGRQAAVMKAATAEQARAAKASTVHASSLKGLVSEAFNLGNEFEKIPTPITMVAGALGDLAAKGALAGAAIAGVSIYLAQGFQTAMTRLHTQANVSEADVAKLSQGVLNMSAAVATTPKVLADAAYHIASVGQGSLTTAQQLNILKVAAEGAKMGGADLVDVTNALDAAIVSNMKGVHDYAQTMGVLNATVGAGDMSMQDLADAFGPLGSTFKAYNVTIQQAGAALAVFGDNNLRGADAGTQLRMGIMALTKPVKGATDALKLLGITGKDATSHFALELQHGGLTAALDDLHNRLKRAGITTAQTGKVLVDAFGRKAGIGLTTLLEELGRYHTKLREVSADGGTFNASWAAYTKTFQFNADSARAALDKVGIELGNRLLPIATKVLHWIATKGVADLDKFGRWFEQNKAGISDFANVFIQAMRFIVVAALHFASDILAAMDAALGWIPHWGKKIGEARKSLDSFASGVNSTMSSLADQVYALGHNVGDNLTGGVVAGITTSQGYAISRAYKLGADVGAAVKAGAKVKSPSQITTYVGKMLAEGLIGGFTGEAGRIKALLSTATENALNALTSRVLSIVDRQKGILKAAQQRLAGDLASQRSDVANLAGSMASGADISNAFTTDANGNTVLGNIGAFLSGQAGPLGAEAAALKQAAGMHLNAVSLSQIANLSTSQALAALQQILSGGSGYVGQINSAQAQVAKYANAGASVVEGQVYAGRLAADRRDIREQTVRLRKIEHWMEAIYHQAARDVARNVHITVDSKGRMKLTEEDGREIVRELRQLARKGIKP